MSGYSGNRSSAATAINRLMGIVVLAPITGVLALGWGPKPKVEE